MASSAQLRHLARLDPADRHKRVVLIIDDAPWHRDEPIDEASAEHPHLEFCRLPRDGPELNVIERSWERRRRAAHNRQFDDRADLERSLRAGLCDFRTVRGRIRTLIAGCYAHARDQSVTTGT
jgi:transposase